MGLRGVVLATALALPATAQAAGSPAVAALQVALNARGAQAGAVDGVLGPQTKAAVVRFQRRGGLPPDGVAGAQKRRALGRLGKPSLGSRVLRLGAVGADVAALEFALALRGAPSGPFDGRFGPRVHAAVVRFQTGAGLVPDGVVGPLTLTAIRQRPVVGRFVLRRPISGPVNTGFGPRGNRFHTGIDIPAATGRPVGAAASGRVVFAGWRDGGWGRTVIVAHGHGVRTLYAHLSAVVVAVGARVVAGSVVGLVGATGRATGPHLHFEVRYRGLAVDPLPLLGA